MGYNSLIMVSYFAVGEGCECSLSDVIALKIQLGGHYKCTYVPYCFSLDQVHVCEFPYCPQTVE